MPAVFPFRAVRFAAEAHEKGGAADVSALIAPPYDVLDAEGKAGLLAREPRNIVGIDLPHVPASGAGPAGVYARAGAAYRGMLADGTLRVVERMGGDGGGAGGRGGGVMFVYRQSFLSEDGSREMQRTGMACTVEAVAFGARAGGGVLPHEETFGGPKADRLALMHATKAQLSPIFGLHVDARGLAAAVLRGVCESRGPDRVALTDDGTGHEVWTVDDAQTIKEYQAALDTEDVYIADGHHRYTTALNYLAELGRAGGVPAADHPARRCMMVLVGMADPGLVIRPTHRVLGGMRDYTFEKFLAAAGSEAGGFHITTTIPLALEKMGRMRVPEDALSPGKANEISFYDYATGGYAVGQVARVDPLAERFPDKPRAWRTLDVTIIQHMIVEKICQPLFNSGRPVEWAFPHTIAEVERLGREPGTTAQLAVIVRPTPLSAVREVGAAPGGHLMPHKSTYFHPKLATGLFVHPLE